MFPTSIRMHFVTLLLVFVVPFVYGQDRKISSILNPGCELCTVKDTLVYIQAKGSNDTVHQIWDFTRGIPTMIFMIAGINSTVNITWDGTQPKEFVINEEPKYSFGMAIDKLIEYDDIQDLGHIDPRSPQREQSLRHARWTRNATAFSDKEALAVVKGRLRDRRGSLDIKLDLLPFKDYAVDLPHLIHTANSTLCDVSLVNLSQSRDYNSSRFALHFVLASTDDSNDTMRYSMRKSLDDEHTPGVFEIVEIKTPESWRQQDGGFVQFRPVGYTQPQRGVTTSTNTYLSSFNRTALPRDSTLERYFRSHSRAGRVLAQGACISFGESGDGFYRQHNYTAWSFTIGYGTPPMETFSLFVILIISIGLGVPVALAMSGVTYVLIKRYKSRNAPARFTDEE